MGVEGKLWAHNHPRTAKIKPPTFDEFAEREGYLPYSLMLTSLGRKRYEMSVNPLGLIGHHSWLP